MNAGKSRQPISVLLVDDHAILREGVHALLAREPDILVVGEAGDGQEALEQVPELQPDVVIMDIVMPRMNGLEATRLLKERHPGGAHAHPEHVRRPGVRGPDHPGRRHRATCSSGS